MPALQPRYMPWEWWAWNIVITSPPGGMRSTVMSMSVCLSVCLFTCISRKPYSQTSVFCMFIAAVAQFCSGSVSICYVLLILWTTLCFHILAKWGFMCIPNQWKDSITVETTVLISTRFCWAIQTLGAKSALCNYLVRNVLIWFCHSMLMRAC